ncbi:AMP-binding protein [Amphiplicatus metriothermophilus]|uniref:Malonyl-CoA/methylmalonyl-CoA synthetase n=1 Tax=Amphiplicatus metriothermophilus TaxID=1519374 RepID=A0A239PPN3_9PROT|nr:AMP-binding protein [Amphiplicatus metriothermophilus]SNT72098.1 malonyl-CoA/methylmalonyl-CoA synthetase [Amphiplicatus metriothermophilus]
MTDGGFFSLLRARFPMEAPCLTIPGGPVWTYAMIDALSARIAGALLACGARPGDRVAVQVEKSAQNVALYLAALRTGLVYVPLNTAYTDEEVAFFLTDAEPAVFICAPEREDAFRPAARAAGTKAIMTLDADGRGTLIDCAEDNIPYTNIEPRAEDDTAVILYTSGTTGRSKGTVLTQRNLASNALALHEIWGFRPGDALLHALPIFHIHGLFVALHTAMLNGAEIIFLPAFDVAAVRENLKRATVMMGVPTFYARLLADPDFGAEDCAGVRLFVSGSAPLSPETFKAFEARTGHRILERYGMSEAGMIASNPLDGARIPGTVGFALPDVYVRITDETGVMLPPGEPGNVEVKGPNVFAGYWRQPEKTKEAFRGPWFVTGDIGALDEEGRLSLVGRAKDLVIAGGYNIYPAEIEQILDAIPGVAESAVIGVPHPDMGEGVVAVLAPQTGAPRPDDAALAAALERLARFKRPRRFFWIDALPRNAMGKVQKQALRERFKDAFAVGES